MLRIGLTGGIGSGKSAVRDLLAARGAEVFDADAVARRLMQEDADVKTALENVLGPEAWLPDGSLNKPWIAERIFGNDTVREAVNAIVHPAVHTAFDRQADAAEKRGIPILVREAALIPGPEQRQNLDLLVAVIAPRAVRLQRVLQRDAMTVSEIESRMHAQPDDELYAALADDVIRNDGTLADLEERVASLWNAWTATSADDSGPSFSNTP